MSNPEDPDRKPPPQPTQAWDPAQVPGPDAASGDADPGATVAFTPEDIARLEEAGAAVEQAASQEDPLLGTLIRDKWKVLKRLGAGSFGTVYKVEDVKGGWVEALKILGVDRLTGAEAEEMRARFLREAQIMKRLGKDSKHIVGLSTYEEDIEAGLVYFLMEFVEGQSLADALAAEGPFTVERTVSLALQVCEALMVAHEGPEPVVHRDLKLENLMLTTDRSGEETVKVLDFGIAKIAEREADSRLTTVGTLGTPGYAAPEQLRAEPVDGRTDLFAFGVILYALLTGRDPWLGNLAHRPTHQIYELMVATDRAEVRPMVGAGTTIPPAMVAIVLKLLSRDPAERFQSARELRSALLALQSGVAPTVMLEGSGAAARAGPSLGGVGAPPERSGTPADATAVRAERSTPRSRPAPRRKSRRGLVAFLLLLVTVGSAAAWARPWGRALEPDALLEGARAGSIPRIWVTPNGFEGGIRVIPIEAAADLLVPFTTSPPEAGVSAFVAQLRSAGVDVDASWEVWRLRGLAIESQGRGRYYGLDGGDVRSYALRLLELDPDNAEAASLLLKVAERMAWDADAALADGTPEAAAEIVRACLELLPDHPRCLEVSGLLP